jgi:hypothetical protein
MIAADYLTAFALVKGDVSAEVTIISDVNWLLVVARICLAHETGLL